MDDVAREIIVVQKCHGQPEHLRVMCFEKLLYVVSVSHTLIRHTTSTKLNPRMRKNFEKLRILL